MLVSLQSHCPRLHAGFFGYNSPVRSRYTVSAPDMPLSIVREQAANGTFV